MSVSRRFAKRWFSLKNRFFDPPSMLGSGTCSVMKSCTVIYIDINLGCIQVT